MYSSEQLAPLRKVLLTVDRLMDIMNATSKVDADFKDCERIDKPTHELLGELCVTLNMFTEWKEEAGTFRERFIPRESFDDIIWIVVSIVGLSWKNLDDDGSKILSQDRCMSDCCEFHFGNIRMRNESAGIQNCEHATAHAQAVRTHTFSMNGTNNNAGARKETLTELMAPLSKK